MGRSINYHLRDRILEYLKLQWDKNEGKSFECSLSKIAESVGQAGHEFTIMNYINRLERAGKINVKRREGRLSNIYTIPLNKKNNNIDNNEVAQEGEVANFGNVEYVNSDEWVNLINNALNKVNEGVDELYVATQKILQENTISRDKIEYLQNALNSLQLFGKTNDGLPMFTLPKDINMEILIDNTKREANLN
jgi:hypothetical protein